MNTEAIQRVAQNLPSHMMQTLSAVANQTPHYPHTPGGAYGAPNYINTVRINAVTFTINVQKLRLFLISTAAIHKKIHIVLRVGTLNDIDVIFILF